LSLLRPANPGGSEQLNRAQQLQYPAALRRHGDFDVIDDDESCSCGFYVLAFFVVVGVCMLVAGILGFVLDGYNIVWLMLTMHGAMGAGFAIVLPLFTGRIVTFDVPRSATPREDRMATVTSWRLCCLPCMGRSEKSCRCLAIKKVVASGGDGESAAHVALHLPKSCGGGTIRTYKVRGNAEQEAANWRAYLAGELSS